MNIGTEMKELRNTKNTALNILTKESVFSEFFIIV